MQALLIPHDIKKQEELKLLGYSFNTDNDSADLLIVTDVEDKEATYWQGYYKALKKDIIVVADWKDFILSHNKDDSKLDMYEKIIRYLSTALFSYMGETTMDAKGNIEFYINGDMVSMFKQTYSINFDFEELAKNKEQLHVRYTPKK